VMEFLGGPNPRDCAMLREDAFKVCNGLREIIHI
jgi:hypothetical protein